MFQLGLLPFMFGIPVMFWALAAAVNWFEELEGPRRPARLRVLGVRLGVLCFVLFYCHVFPFGLFGLGFALLFPWTRPRDWITAVLPPAPTLAVMAWWFAFTESGKIARGAVGSTDPVAPLDRAISEFNKWALDVFKDTSDEKWLIALLITILLAWGLAQGDRDETKPAARAFVALPIMCLVLYFRMSEARGPVWLFSQRFPILCLMTLVPLLRFPRGVRGFATTIAATGVAVGSIVTTCRHYIAFERDEIGAFDEALEQIPPGKRVASLVYDKYSHVVNWAPFVHFGSYYQAGKGGVIEFSYAGFAHWPFSFKPGAWPPHSGLPPDSKPPESWEWRPEAVAVQGELYPYYDYVLTRGDGFAPPPGTFHIKWHGDRWAVWQRD
jgi:hypothetical protein